MLTRRMPPDIALSQVQGPNRPPGTGSCTVFLDLILLHLASAPERQKNHVLQC
jgi:hypothetical protein